MQMRSDVMPTKSSPGRRRQQVNFNRNASKNSSRLKMNQSKKGAAAESDPDKNLDKVMTRLSKSAISFSKTINKQQGRKK